MIRHFFSGTGGILMKALKTLLFAAGMMLLATAVSALDCNQPAGIYSTTAGTLLPGRSSEAWCNPAMQFAGVPGNTENAMSWDGTMLGSQWRFWGMAIDENGAVESARSIDAYGTGWIDYVTNYVGGQFWLFGGHSWSDDGTDLVGDVTYLNVGARVNLFQGVVTGVTSNILITGQFTTCPNCVIQYSILNAMRVWDPTGGSMPPLYPAWACGTTGELFYLCCITANIVCDEVGTEESTWGAVKQMHK
jgi:hypothetical protein